MPVTLSENDVFDSDLDFPAPLDAGSVASGSPLRTFGNKVANRTRWLYNKITGGVPRIQYYSSTASLAAVTGQVNGDVAIVNGTYLGIYIYDTSNSGPDLSPWFVKPSGFLDATPGRWRHLFHSFGVNNTSYVDGNRWIVPGANYLPTTPAYVTSASGTVTMTASNQDVGPSLTINSLLAGDRLVIDADFGFDPNGSGNTATIGLTVSGENGGSVFSDSEVLISAALPAYRARTQLVCMLAADGNKTIQMKARDSSISSGANQIKGKYQLRALVIRP